MRATTVTANRESQPFLRRGARNACRPSHIASHKCPGTDDERTASRAAERGHSQTHRLHAAAAAFIETKRTRSRPVSARERPLAGAVRLRDRRAILRHSGAGEADADARGA